MVAASAGLAASNALGGVEEVVWVEVDNTVGTIDQTAGVPTGLNGVRTFDLYAVVTPDTKVWVADFGYVGDYQGYDENMWTTQSVYQNEFGRDVQAPMVGSMEMFAALEFDTYVGMGMLDSKIVMNTVILGGNWSSSGFELAWYGSQYSGGVWEPAVGDEDDLLFLARVSVASDGAYGDTTGDDEWLGGWVFISGEDNDGRFGQADPKTGLFYAENAFPEPVAVIAGTNGGGGSGGAEETPDEPEPLYGDVNLDDVVDMVDLMLVQRSIGTSNSSRDVNGDGIVDAVDVAEIMEILGSSETFAGSGGGGVDDGAAEDEYANLTPKERKKLEKAQRKAEQQRLKAERKAVKADAKERKRQEKERKKADKQREKERKKAEKERKKREKQQQG